MRQSTADDGSEHVDSADPAKRARLRAVALVAISVGLSMVVLGIVVGNLAYQAERPFWRSTQKAIEGLNGTQLADGAVLTGIKYPAPSVGETVLRQPSTGLGVFTVIVGVFLLAASGPPSVAPVPCASPHESDADGQDSPGPSGCA